MLWLSLLDRGSLLIKSPSHPIQWRRFLCRGEIHFSSFFQVSLPQKGILGLGAGASTQTKCWGQAPDTMWRVACTRWQVRTSRCQVQGPFRDPIGPLFGINRLMNGINRLMNELINLHARNAIFATSDVRKS